MDEADLVSSQEPTQNDYLADESGVDAQVAEVAGAESQARESVYLEVELYVRRDSASGHSLGAREADNGSGGQSRQRNIADPASAEVVKPLSISEMES